jgi:hypothetical protein
MKKMSPAKPQRRQEKKKRIKALRLCALAGKNNFQKLNKKYFLCSAVRFYYVTIFTNQIT